jgi:hypothetical protein
MSTLRVSNIEAKADASSPTIDEKVKVTNSQGRVLVQIDGKTAGITSIGINTTSTSFTIDGNQNVQFVGVITAANVNTTGVSTFSRLNVGTGGTIITTTTGGLVGIGTTNPTQRLEVLGQIIHKNNPGSIILRDSTSNIVELNIRPNSGNSGFLSFTEDSVDDRWVVGIESGSNSLLFKTGNPVTNTERLRADSSGNLQLSTANTSILNSSGRKILNQTGGILQVVSTTKTNTFSTTSGTMVDVTGLSASITPTSTSNKILVHYSVHMGQNAQYYLSAGDITRNGTAIALADADGSRQRATFGTQDGGGIHGSTYCYAGSYLDSPSSTSSLTYQIRIRSEGGNTVWVNRGNEADGDANYTQRLISMITLMEVAG